MVISKAATVQEYLDSLPEEDRKVIAAVRKVIRKNLPRGYEENMNWGMISYEVPLSRYPVTYNKQPLAFAGLAAQKNNFALYLMCVCGDTCDKESSLKEELRRAGPKLSMGKSCIRFKKLEHLPLDIVARAIANMPVDKWIAIYEASRKR